MIWTTADYIFGLTLLNALVIAEYALTKYGLSRRIGLEVNPLYSYLGIPLEILLGVRFLLNWAVVYVEPLFFAVLGANITVTVVCALAILPGRRRHIAILSKK